MRLLFALLLLVLAAAITGLTWYGWPPFESRSAIAAAFVPNLITLFLEVVVIGGVVALLRSRQWGAARQLVNDIVASDIHRIISFVDQNAISAQKSETARGWLGAAYTLVVGRPDIAPYRSLLRHLESQEVSMKLACLSAALEATSAKKCGDYLEGRSRLLLNLRDLSDGEFNDLLIKIDVNTSPVALAARYSVDKLQAAKYARQHFWVLFNKYVHDFNVRDFISREFDSESVDTVVALREFDKGVEWYAQATNEMLPLDEAIKLKST